MASTPSYASNPLAPDIVAISVANANRDGSGTMVELCAGTASGVVIEQVRVKAVGTTTAGMVRFFLSKDNGATKALLTEVLVTANVAGATNGAWTKVIDDLEGLTLKDTTTKLYVSTEKAEAFNVFCHKAGL